MPRFPGNWLRSKACTLLAFALLSTTTVFAKHSDDRPGRSIDAQPIALRFPVNWLPSEGLLLGQT